MPRIKKRKTSYRDVCKKKSEDMARHRTENKDRLQPETETEPSEPVTNTMDDQCKILEMDVKLEPLEDCIQTVDSNEESGKECSVVEINTSKVDQSRSIIPATEHDSISTDDEPKLPETCNELEPKLPETCNELQSVETSGEYIKDDRAPMLLQIDDNHNQSFLSTGQARKAVHSGNLYSEVMEIPANSTPEREKTNIQGEQYYAWLGRYKIPKLIQDHPKHSSTTVHGKQEIESTRKSSSSKRSGIDAKELKRERERERIASKRLLQTDEEKATVREKQKNYKRKKRDDSVERRRRNEREREPKNKKREDPEERRRRNEREREPKNKKRGKP